MIFKNKKTGKIANIVDDYLINEFKASNDWEVGSESDLPKPVEPIYVEPTYGERVDALIRQRYTLSEELSLLRQKNVKAQEYQDYFNYCEECKLKVKQGGE